MDTKISFTVDALLNLIESNSDELLGLSDNFLVEMKKLALSKQRYVAAANVRDEQRRRLDMVPKDEEKL